MEVLVGGFHTGNSMSGWTIDCNRELGTYVSGTLILRLCRLFTEITGDLPNPVVLEEIT